MGEDARSLNTKNVVILPLRLIFREQCVKKLQCNCETGTLRQTSNFIRESLEAKLFQVDAILGSNSRASTVWHGGALCKVLKITQCIWSNHFSHRIPPEAKFMCDSKVRSQ